MHIHSNHSKDGKSSVKKILEVALRRGLDALAITDHDTVSGSLEAIEVVREEHLEIVVIPGIEVSTLDGHLLIYGVKKDIDPSMSMSETIKEVKKHSELTLTAVAHPFQFYRHGCVKFWIAKQADAVEVFNAKYIVGICNLLSQALAKFYRKPGIAGSDAHVAEEVGRAVTVIDDSVLNSRRRGEEVTRILNAILSGKVVEVRGSRQNFHNWPGRRR